MRFDDSKERLILEGNDDHRIVWHAFWYGGFRIKQDPEFLTKRTFGDEIIDESGSTIHILSPEQTKYLLESGFPEFIISTYDSRFLPKVQEDWEKILALGVDEC